MDEPDIEIGVAEFAERRIALELALRTVPPAHRGGLIASLGQVVDHRLGMFAALVVARRAGQVVAAAWAQPQPGNTAVFWPPECAGSRFDGPLDALVRASLEQCDAAGVSLVQTLTEDPHPDQRALLHRHGIRYLARLQYLEWGPAGHATSDEPGEVRFESYTDAKLTRLKKALAESYEATLDCAELDGVRSLDDVIAGYRANGEYDPALWYLLRVDGSDVGALLLAPHPESDQMELVYMGVALRARGGGVGAAAVARAQRATVERGASRLVLAVDEANLPARKLYSRAGFRQWAQRAVFIRSPQAT